MDFDLTESQREIRQKAREIATSKIAPKAAFWDQTEEYPWENARILADAGFMGMNIPEEFGGPERPLIEAVLVVEEMAKVCGITGRIVVDSNMGVVGAIIKYGTEEQKKKYLPMVLQGDKPAIVITEPEAGSAATDMTTRAVLDGDEYILNGKKKWITGAGVSHINLVFARVVHGGDEQGIGALIVELGAEGFRIGERAFMMGLRGIPESEEIFENCRVPRENLVTVGFGRLMAAYNAQRVGAGTVALGLAEGAFAQAVEYAKKRHQFGRPISEFQGLQWILADGRIQLDAARLLLHRAAVQEDPKTGFPDMNLAAIAKTFSAEASIKVTNDALQIFGAAGYSRDLPIERMARDVRMFTIGGGTTQAQRNVIASGIFGRKFSQRRGE
ncbi:MAG: acyl-CoA dehydrogenase family protein [Nitrospinae bacterium]|nr:acyl-CoA dehydrogenase family protein [Nitrospinota bacterium]